MPASDKTWQEWSQKVLTELTTLNNRYEQLAGELDEKYELMQSNLEERYKHINEKLEKINELLNGNGSPEKGLIIRVDRIEQQNVGDLDIRIDRLEQSEKRRSWLMRSTIVAALGAIVAQVWGYFVKVP